MESWIDIWVLQFTDPTAGCCSWVPTGIQLAQPVFVAWVRVAIPSVHCHQQLAPRDGVCRVAPAEMDVDLVAFFSEDPAVGNATHVSTVCRKPAEVHVRNVGQRPLLQDFSVHINHQLSLLLGHHPHTESQSHEMAVRLRFCLLRSIICVHKEWLKAHTYPVFVQRDVEEVATAQGHVIAALLVSCGLLIRGKERDFVELGPQLEPRTFPFTSIPKFRGALWSDDHELAFHHVKALKPGTNKCSIDSRRSEGIRFTGFA
mmetsp:Transcript_10833/g.19292  ORF Transcript_10833/g.19292 Transcript_10833/m.19292 type:complete len:259 (-) Transcript_10833:526-1302(-)